MKIVALAGGVGGARMADGLARLLPPQDLTIIVNTGDDFRHYGLYICPDVDTVCYTLAGMANPENGWGRADETFHALQSMEALGGPSWFSLGDRDLGLHLERTRRLDAGQTLTGITYSFCQALGVRPRVLPMSDSQIPTYVDTDEGWLPFQEYFVHRQCSPRVKGFRFVGTERGRPAPGVLDSLAEADLVVICPSNPWVSIGPIMALPGVKQAILTHPAVAVSPIIGGKAVKGPAAKMYAELGIQPSAWAVAEHYGSRQSGGILTGFVLDRVDESQASQVEQAGIQPLVTDTLMKTSADRLRLAGEVIEAFNK